MIIVPSTFVVDERYIRWKIQYIIGMWTIVGNLDIFDTIKWNPNLAKIQRHISLGQMKIYRIGIVFILLRIKKDMMRAVFDKEIFFSCVDYLRVVDFQKRSLTHSLYLYLIQFQTRKHWITPKINYIILVKIPPHGDDPTFRKLVLAYIICGRCADGNPKSICMNYGCCTKGFPIQYR